MARIITSLFFLTSLFAIGCDCAGPVAMTCSTDDECGAGMRCRDGLCAPGAQGDGGDRTCDDGRAICGAVCCDSDRVCNAGACRLDCGAEPICGGTCCGAGESCVDDACVIECADDARRCGDTCCGGEQACLGGGCVDLGEPCEFTEQCDVERICEPTLMRCVPRDAVEVCEFRPPVGEFTPTIACQWRPPPGPFASYQDVVMTPAVMNLTDDNGDGETNELDIPDIVFIAFDRPTDGCCTARGRLVIASGACNPDGSMKTHAIIDSHFVDNSSGVALGNLHPDTMPEERAPEIVATLRNGGTVAFTRTADDGSAWEELWRSPAPSNEQMSSGGAPSLADLDGDGQPEVIIGNVVLDGLTGAVVWDGAVTVGPHAGVGNNAFLGPSSTVADLDLDGQMEVIAGNTVYDGRTGAQIWTFDYESAAFPCGGHLRCDGFNGVGNFDEDPEGEVVIVRRGEVFVLEHDGTLKHRVRLPVDDTRPYRGDGPCPHNEAGPPTIADFDGDGRPEIGTAGADFYVVVDFDCVGSPLPDGCEAPNILWTVPNQDCSSRATGSSVFDFEGDGAAEVVYADERTFRIFDGRTGAILYEDATHSSNTRLEMPIVVDVDNDGKSEIVVPEPNPNTPNRGGIEIWEDADNNWVRTRRVWNQHAYYVTNITEDGQVPRVADVNWLSGRLNNFRQNVQPSGLFDAPDLTVTSIAVDQCITPGTLRVAVTVENRGALGVPPGIAVWGRVRLPDGTVIDVGVVHTVTRLLPGGSEVVVFTWDAGGPFPADAITFEAIVDDDGMGAGAYNECDETNNSLTEELMTCRFG